MATDLKLFPMQDRLDLTTTTFFPQTILRTGRDYKLFDQIQGEEATIKTTEIPPQLWVAMYKDEGIINTRTDDDEETLRFVYAKELKKIDWSIVECEESINKAIKAFINALADDIPIILYWC